MDWKCTVHSFTLGLWTVRVVLYIPTNVFGIACPVSWLFAKKQTLSNLFWNVIIYESNFAKAGMYMISPIYELWLWTSFITGQSANETSVLDADIFSQSSQNTNFQANIYEYHYLLPDQGDNKSWEKLDNKSSRIQRDDYTYFLFNVYCHHML